MLHISHSESFLHWILVPTMFLLSLFLFLVCLIMERFSTLLLLNPTSQNKGTLQNEGRRGRELQRLADGSKDYLQLFAEAGNQLLLMMLVGMMESLARRMRHFRLDIRTQRLLEGAPHLPLKRLPAPTLVSCVFVLVRLGSSVVGVLNAVAAHGKAKLHQDFILFTVVMLYLTKIVLG